jgi:SAM-dependent methyltransferase
MIERPVASDFEYVSCCNCGSDNADIYADHLEDWLCGLDGQFTLVKCRQCGLIRQNPRPGPRIIERYYPEQYKPFADTRFDPSLLSSLQKWTIEYGLRRRVRTVARHQPTGRLLDVGCATGQFLAAAQRYGHWQVQGVEPSVSAAKFGRQKLGLDIRLGSLADAEFADATFDIVTMWDVLEHLHDPVAAAREVARILRPGGICIARAPHLEGIDARVFGRYWAGLDAPRHLHLFPRRILQSILARAGFTCLEQRCWGSYHVSVLSLQFWLKAHGVQTRRSLFIQRFLLSFPVRLLALPAFVFIDGVLKRGSTLTIVSRKERDD